MRVPGMAGSPKALCSPRLRELRSFCLCSTPGISGAGRPRMVIAGTTGVGLAVSLC